MLWYHSPAELADLREEVAYPPLADAADIFFCSA